jgi:TRAP-type C4-dicarboxylate transport system permease large subunit
MKRKDFYKKMCNVEIVLAMYIVCGTLDCKLQDYLIESIPFVFAVLLIIAIYMCIPDVILFLPNLLYG